MRKVFLLAGVLGLLAAAACGKTDASGEGQKPAAGANVLGPTGFGKLQLGSSEAQVKSLGMTVEKIGPSGFCKNGEKTGVDGVVAFNSLTKGVAVVNVTDAKAGVQTPEGIKIGSTLADVQKAYPKLAGGITEVPGNANGQFLFFFLSGKVSEMDLMLKGQDCI